MKNGAFSLFHLSVKLEHTMFSILTLEVLQPPNKF